MNRFVRPLLRIVTAAALTLAASGMAMACSKALTFGTIDYPPYVMWQADGSVRGLDAELLDGVMKEAGCAYRLIQVPFKRALRDVAFGALDGMPVASYNAERAAGGYFTLPVRREIIAAFARPADMKARALTSLGDLIASGLKVTYVLGGWHGEPFMKAVAHDKAFRAHVGTATDFETLFRTLHAGLTDIAVVDILTGRQTLKDHPALGPALALDFPVNVDTLHMMLSRKTVTPADVAAINAAIKRFRANPAYMATVRRYAPADMADFIASTQQD